MLACALAAVLLFVMVGKLRTPRLAPSGATQTEVTPSGPLALVRNWGYQLQKIDPVAIAQSPYDLVVIDYAREGRSESEFSKDAIQRMKRKPNGQRRLLLAYLSIGEAEDYRSYWKTAWRQGEGRPAWLGEENASWNGNYLVRFWDTEWQNLVFAGPGSYLDRIMDLGFDGVFLDRIDVYPNWEAEEPNARQLMIELVQKISSKAKTKNPGFIVFAQNAEELLEQRSYRIYIDGIVKEDLLFGNATLGEPNASADIEYSTSLLKMAQRKNKAVFIIEYLYTAEDQIAAKQKLDELNFVYYFGPRLLNRLGNGLPVETVHRRPQTGDMTSPNGIFAWLSGRISHPWKEQQALPSQ